MTFEKIKRFLDEKIFHRRSQKLLMPGNNNEKNEINLNEIYNYMNDEKYIKDFAVTFTGIAPKIRKKLMQKLENTERGSIINTHDSFPIIEGFFANEHFISVRRKNVKINKIGQTIVTENSYIDISTRKDYANENAYNDLSYKEYKKTENIEEKFEFEEEEESYYRKIKKGDIVYIESAAYDNQEKIEEVECSAQPIHDSNTINEYLKITGLSYIANREHNHISDILKADPYVVNIQAYKGENSENLISKIEIIKIFKSKKECIVGYRPEIIFIKKFSKEKYNEQMYRLLPTGEYVDNSSFKLNFEGKYTIRHIKLEEIEKLVENIPFGLSSKTKSILRNSLKIKNYIKVIYNKGLEKIQENL